VPPGERIPALPQDRGARLLVRVTGGDQTAIPELPGA